MAEEPALYHKYVFYSCVLNDFIPVILGTAFSPFLFAGVWGFSELFFMKEPQDVTVTRKDPVFLDCQAHGEGPVKVTWLKNGAKLSENKRIQVLSNGSLYIREVEGRRGEHSDEGFYQCLAVNKYGAILSQKAHLTLSSKSLMSSWWYQFLILEGFFFNWLMSSTKSVHILRISPEMLIAGANGGLQKNLQRLHQLELWGPKSKLGLDNVR